MGGFGSGGGRGAVKTNELRCVDLVDLKRLGFLKDRFGGWFRWLRNGDEVARIHIQRERDSLIFRYKYSIAGDDNWKDIEERFYLTGTEQPFGGYRIWIVCPSCHRRCRAVYGGARFRCRRCYGATYESQYNTYFDQFIPRSHNRLIDKAQSIREKLGGSGAMIEAFPKKPKWMRRKTYRELERQDEQAASILDATLERWGL